jgi:hypothetical protein
MQNKNKTLAISIALLLTISMVSSIMLIPTANAHTPAWQIPTYAYIVVAPDPIGVGQTVHVYFWLDAIYGAAGGTTAAIGTNGSTASAALLANNYRFQNYNLSITAPDGTTTTQIFAVISDPTSSWYTKFTPSQVGNYTLVFTFPGQVYGANGNGYEKSPLVNDTYLPSSASTTLTVQQEPIPAAINSYPLPQNYWSQPIYGENTDWWAISSNWLGSGAPVTGGYSASGYGWQMYKSDTVGPLTPHVMWTRPLQFGGVVGGNQFVAGGTNPNGAVPGAEYFEGTSYQSRYTNPIIISGYLYYTEPVSFTGPSSGTTDCVDLRTGQVIWSRSDVPALSFGYIFNLWDQDQHGTYPPILFTANFARAFDAYTGDPMFNVTGVPTGTTVLGPSGEQIKYILANAGTTANPQWYLSEWNSSKLWQYDIQPFTGAGSLSPSVVNASNLAVVTTNPYPQTSSSYGDTITVNANIPINSTTVIAGSHGLTTYDWNISVPWRNTMALTPTVAAANFGDVMLCRNGSLPSGFAATGSGASQGPYTYFAVNLNASKGSIGQILWMKNYNPPAGNITVNSQAVDFQTRVFLLSYQETMQWVGFSLDTGAPLWGPTASQGAFDYYGIPGTTTLASTVAYGNLYCSSFSGILYCYNDLTGQIVWTYGNGGEGNSTYGGFNVFYGHYPTMISSISNGVVYTATDEHTITNPLYKGSTARAINATDGTEIWQLSDYPGTAGGVNGPWAAADGFATFMNGLDNNIYSIGRGPSATSIQAPLTQITAGEKLVIQGTVTDISAGTKQTAQAANFPNGVPCSSDASMKDWMGYVYQQQSLPTNFTGVPVSIVAIDPNGNYITIGSATTDTNGLFHYIWAAPDIPGGYSVYAMFAGTNGYWASNAETTLTVQSAPQATVAPTSTPTSVADTYFVPAIAGLFVLIIIVLAMVMVLILRKRL